MYKDKDKQREAVKAATQRYRAKKGDSALSGSKAVSQNAPESSVVAEVGVIPCDTRLKVIPEDTPDVILCEAEPVKPKRGKDIKTFEDLPPDVQREVQRAVGPMPADTYARRVPKSQSHSPMMVGYVPPKN